MIIRHFRTNYSIITTFVWLSLLFALKLQTNSILLNDTADASLSNSFLRFLSSDIHLAHITLFVVVCLLSFSNYLLNNIYIIDQYRSLLPMLLSVILLGCGPFIFSLSEAHISMLFILLALLPILNLHKASKPQNNLANASLILSFGSLMDMHLLYFIPFVWLSTLLLKRLNLKTFGASLIGLLIPYCILLGILYLNDNLQVWYTEFTNHFNWFTYVIGNPTQGFFIFSAILAVFLLYVLASIFPKVDRLKTNSRKVIGVCILFLFYSFLLFGLGLINLTSAYIYSVFPISILFSIHLNHIRPRIATIQILVLVLGSLMGFIVEF